PKLTLATYNANNKLLDLFYHSSALIINQIKTVAAHHLNQPVMLLIIQRMGQHKLSKIYFPDLKTRFAQLLFEHLGTVAADHILYVKVRLLHSSQYSVFKGEVWEGAISNNEPFDCRLP